MPMTGTTFDHLRRAGVRGLAERSPVAMVMAGVVLFSTGPVMVGAASVSGPVFSFWRLWIGVAVLAVATPPTGASSVTGPPPPVGGGRCDAARSSASASWPS